MGGIATYGPCRQDHCPSDSRDDVYLSFQLPQDRSNWTSTLVWSCLGLNKCATGRQLQERQASPYRWQRNMQIRNGTDFIISQATIYPTFYGKCSVGPTDIA